MKIFIVFNTNFNNSYLKIGQFVQATVVAKSKEIAENCIFLNYNLEKEYIASYKLGDLTYTELFEDHNENEASIFSTELYYE